MQTIEERTMGIFKKVFDIEPNLEDNLEADHHLDSLDHVELIMEAEDEFKIAIPDLEAETIKTPADLIRVVKKISGAA